MQSMTDFNSFFKEKNILITGGLGFIGSNLAHKLAELGAVVTLVDDLDPGGGGNMFNVSGIEKRVKIATVDVGDVVQMEGLVKGQDFMFNLAGQTSHLGSMRDPFFDLKVNTVDQLKILELCRRQNPQIRIVYAGTRQIYGHPQYLPVDEKHLVVPADYNGVSKRAGEMYHIVANRIYGLWTAVLRMTNVYGPRMRLKDDRQGFVGWWFHQLLEGEELLIFGDGQRVRDINYVDDVVEALLLCAMNPAAQGEIFNLGSDPVTLLNLARLMIEVNGGGRYRLTPFPADRKRIEIGDYFGNYNKILTQLGWQPKIRLRAGIGKTLEYYRQYKEHYR